MTHYIGDVFLWTKNWDGSGIQGCLKCDGSTYSVDDFSALYVVLGYQGVVNSDSTGTTFTTPDLMSSAPEGLTPYIVATGTFPPSPYSFPYYRVVSSPYIGEVDYTTATYPDSGWAFCDGSLVNTSQSTALFSVISNSFGGNGTKNFALPTIAGAVIAVTGNYPQRG